jgi:hypothetical protein
MFNKLYTKIFLIILLVPSMTKAVSIIDDPDGDPITVVDGLEALIFRLQDIVFATAGGIAVAMIIWGAIVLITAGGNEERVAKGKKTLTYAIGGAIFIIASYTIIKIFINILGGSVS